MSKMITSLPADEDFARGTGVSADGTDAVAPRDISDPPFGVIVHDVAEGELASIATGGDAHIEFIASELVSVGTYLVCPDGQFRALDPAIDLAEGNPPVWVWGYCTKQALGGDRPGRMTYTPFLILPPPEEDPG